MASSFPCFFRVFPTNRNGIALYLIRNHKRFISITNELFSITGNNSEKQKNRFRPVFSKFTSDQIALPRAVSAPKIDPSFRSFIAFNTPEKVSEEISLLLEDESPQLRKQGFLNLRYSIQKYTKEKRYSQATFLFFNSYDSIKSNLSKSKRAELCGLILAAMCQLDGDFMDQIESNQVLELAYQSTSNPSRENHYINALSILTALEDIQAIKKLHQRIKLKNIDRDPSVQEAILTAYMEMEDFVSARNVMQQIVDISNNFAHPTVDLYHKYLKSWEVIFVALSKVKQHNTIMHYWLTARPDDKILLNKQNEFKLDNWLKKFQKPSSNLGHFFLQSPVILSAICSACIQFSEEKFLLNALISSQPSTIMQDPQLRENVVSLFTSSIINDLTKSIVSRFQYSYNEGPHQTLTNDNAIFLRNSISQVIKCDSVLSGLKCMALLRHWKSGLNEDDYEHILAAFANDSQRINKEDFDTILSTIQLDQASTTIKMHVFMLKIAHDIKYDTLVHNLFHQAENGPENFILNSQWLIQCIESKVFDSRADFFLSGVCNLLDRGYDDLDLLCTSISMAHRTNRHETVQNILNKAKPHLSNDNYFIVACRALLESKFCINGFPISLQVFLSPQKRVEVNGSHIQLLSSVIKELSHNISTIKNNSATSGIYLQCLLLEDSDQALPFWQSLDSVVQDEIMINESNAAAIVAMWCFSASNKKVFDEIRLKVLSSLILEADAVELVVNFIQKIDSDLAERTKLQIQSAQNFS